MQYSGNWESLQRFEPPRWLVDAKFGIFIHWGLFSVPEQGCWYGRGMYDPGQAEWYMHDPVKWYVGRPWYQHHLKTYGHCSEFGYKDFIPMFKAENFDPKAWVDLFRKAGARYVVPVTDFHDGFAMYDSKLTDYTVVKMGPKRDVFGELKEETLGQGLKYGVSSHYAFNWMFYPKHSGLDTCDPALAQLYGPPASPNFMQPDFVRKWSARTTELIDTMEPDMLYFDFGIGRAELEQARLDIAAYYYNKAGEWGKGLALAYKDEAFRPGTAILDIERGRMETTQPMVWQTDTSVGWEDWSYYADESYKPADLLIRELVDIVSKNGCLLLSIGPRPDGTIPEVQAQILEEIGDWMQVNGEAIYETRPWIQFGEGPTNIFAAQCQEHLDKDRQYTPEDMRFTTREDAFYAILMAWPGRRRVHVTSLAGNALLGRKVTSVELLGHGKIDHTLDAYGLFVEFPDQKPCNHCYTIKVNLA